MTPQPIARDSHYVPQAILRRWSADGTNIYAYRSLVSNPNVPEWSFKAISGLGYQRDLYTIFAGDREVDDFEHWIDANYEHPGLEAVDKLLRRVQMAPSDWKAIARFVAAQDVRTPLTFIELMSRWNRELPEALERWLKDGVRRLEEAKARGDAVPPTTANALSEVVRVSIVPPTHSTSGRAFVKAEVPIGRHLWIANMRHLLSSRANTLCKHPWSVAAPCEGEEWPLTDHPVVRLNYYGPDHYDFRGGWDKLGSELMMPLSQLRPREVDAERFHAERQAWKGWHQNQMEAERS